MPTRAALEKAKAAELAIELQVELQHANETAKELAGVIDGVDAVLPAPPAVMHLEVEPINPEVQA